MWGARATRSCERDAVLRNETGKKMEGPSGRPVRPSRGRGAWRSLLSPLLPSGASAVCRLLPHPSRAVAPHTHTHTHTHTPSTHLTPCNLGHHAGARLRGERQREAAGPRDTTKRARGAHWPNLSLSLSHPLPLSPSLSLADQVRDQVQPGQRPVLPPQAVRGVGAGEGRRRRARAPPSHLRRADRLIGRERCFRLTLSHAPLLSVLSLPPQPMDPGLPAQWRHPGEGASGRVFARGVRAFFSPLRRELKPSQERVRSCSPSCGGGRALTTPAGAGAPCLAGTRGRTPLRGRPDASRAERKAKKQRRAGAMARAARSSPSWPLSPRPSAFRPPAPAHSRGGG